MVGKIGMYIWASIGLLFLIMPVLGTLTGSTTLAIQVIPVSILGAIMMFTAPLHLLIPYTIALALERSERIEAMLAQLTKQP